MGVQDDQDCALREALRHLQRRHQIAGFLRQLFAGLGDPLIPFFLPRQRNLWVTDTVEW